MAAAKSSFTISNKSPLDIPSWYYLSPNCKITGYFSQNNSILRQVFQQIPNSLRQEVLGTDHGYEVEPRKSFQEGNISPD